MPEHTARVIHPFTDEAGQHWDLNDPKTYESEESWFPKECLMFDARDLLKRVEHEIGWSLYYMLCVHTNSRAWETQYNRVLEFGKHFARESREPDRLENVPWLRKQLFLILDETENQC
jgi:hypothetical protein